MTPAHRTIRYQGDVGDESWTPLGNVACRYYSEPPRRLAGALVAHLAPMTGDDMTMRDIFDVESRLLALSDAIAQRYFLDVQRAEKADGADLLS